MKHFFYVILSFLIVEAFAYDARRTIAFERDGTIWVADLEGKAAKKLVPGNLPEISPDATRVAFNTVEPSDKFPSRHIAVVDITSGKVTVLRDMPSDNCFGPVTGWSSRTRAHPAFRANSNFR